MDPHRGTLTPLTVFYETFQLNSPAQLVGENIREWEVALIVLNPDSLYYGGYFKARMSFKSDYPYVPPGELIQRPVCPPRGKSNPPQRFSFPPTALPSQCLPGWPTMH